MKFADLRRQAQAPAQAPATPELPATPLALPHPLIGVAWFKTHDGWRTCRIRSSDPSIIDGPITEPNLRQIAKSYMKVAITKVWEDE